MIKISFRVSCHKVDSEALLQLLDNLESLATFTAPDTQQIANIDANGNITGSGMVYGDFFSVGEDGDVKKLFVDTTTNQTITGTKNFENKNLNFSTVTNGLIGTIRPSDSNNGTLVIEAPSKYLRLTASANNTTLTNAPTATASDTTSKAVATCGWAANLFSAKTHNHDDVYSKLGHTHSGYASSTHTHSGYASSTHTHSEYATADQLDTLTVATADLTEVVGGVIKDIEALDVATFEAAIDEYVATKQASVEEEIEATGQSILDNLDGYLKNDDIVYLDDWYKTGVSGVLTLGGLVEWTGTKLIQDKHVVTYTNGLITSVVTTLKQTIDTPAVITWS